jgi:hypothetical protein
MRLVEFTTMCRGPPLKFSQYLPSTNASHQEENRKERKNQVTVEVSILNKALDATRKRTHNTTQTNAQVWKRARLNVSSIVAVVNIHHIGGAGSSSQRSHGSSRLGRLATQRSRSGTGAFSGKGADWWTAPCSAANTGMAAARTASSWCNRKSSKRRCAT